MLRAALEAVPARRRDPDRQQPADPRRSIRCARGGPPRTVLTQRGAAGIDGLIASAAGATRAGQPVLLVLGDVSFAHDLGGLLAARCGRRAARDPRDRQPRRPDLRGPADRARAASAPRSSGTSSPPPELDPAAVATALGAARDHRGLAGRGRDRGRRARSRRRGVTVIHAPVTATGAHDVRRAALELSLVADGPDRSSCRRNP